MTFCAFKLLMTYQNSKSPCLTFGGLLEWTNKSAMYITTAGVSFLMDGLFFAFIYGRTGLEFMSGAHDSKPAGDSQNEASLDERFLASVTADGKR